MSRTELMNNVSRKFHRFGLGVRKHSPEILVVAGVAGVVTSAVMACKATTKLSGILEEGKEKVNEIHDYVERNGYSEQYTEQDCKKDTTIIYAQTGLKVAKLYAMPVVLGTLSIASILTSNGILRKRNAALAAAYATVDTAFKDYRKRVVDRFGKELDQELRFNVKAKEVEETVVNEDGTQTTVKKTIQVADDPNAYSDYARVFDDGCTGWTKDPEYNFLFLKQQMNWANEKLKARGHLYLNEVYDMLGIPRSKAGNRVGWIYDEKNPVGDNFVDFGIFDTNRMKVRDFINGYERTIILDFNVDGDIWSLMK